MVDPGPARVSSTRSAHSARCIYVNRARGLVIVFTAYMQNDVAKNNLERLVLDYVLPATQ